jgi:hypothetical protein
LFLWRITMLPKPELAYFAIADISGYTSFLARVELDHARDIALSEIGVAGTNSVSLNAQNREDK